MPPKINKKLCNGCSGREESLCQEICPGDLMLRGSDGKASCRSRRDCWDCMSCVKACPRKAIETVLPYQLGYFGATLTAEMRKKHIAWKCRDLSGQEKHYSFRIRNE